MKLKFRAEPKDWVIFGIFCLVLLYFVAIAVLNLSQFANTATFHGFNPFPAFGPDYIGFTIIGFIIAVIASIFGVSDRFFDVEKGFGISLNGKKQKKYSRWATENEIKRELALIRPGEGELDAGGIPLINDGNRIWVDNAEYHNIVIGSTGSGKTQMIVFPMVKILARHNESMIITDPKGEIYEKTAEELKERGYNVILLNFRDPQKGSAWNPLALPYALYKQGKTDKAIELLDDLGMNIIYDEAAQNQDPFWEKTAADYFSGLALGLFEDAKEEEINLNSINLMTNIGEEKSGPSTIIKKYFDMKDPNSSAYINASSTINAPVDTRGSILSVLRQKIKLFASRENLSEMLSHSDFDMHDIGKKKTAVFLVIQDEKKTYHSLLTIFLKQCYETLIDVAQESGGKLQFRTNFIMDEFANMPPLKDVTTMVTAARSRKIRFTFIIQNFAQLTQVYGKENGETIKANCGNILYLISSELSSLDEISKLCGEEKSKEKDKTTSTPLVTVSDLQRLPKWTVILMRIRCMPFKTRLAPNYELVQRHAWGPDYPDAAYPQREKQPLKVFDLKGFVNKKNEDRINQLLSGLNKNPSVSKPSISKPSLPSFPPMNAPLPKMDSTEDMIKKIDAKIAELEAEEKAEKNKEEKDIEKTQEIKPIVGLSKGSTKVNDIKPESKEEKVSDQIKEKIDVQPVIDINKEVEVKDKSNMVEEKEKKSIPEMTLPIKNDKTEKGLKQDNVSNEPTSTEIVNKDNVQDDFDEMLNIAPEINNDVSDVSNSDDEKITDDQFFDDFFTDDEEE